MWTRKTFTFTGGIALVLIGMMISNQQMMILGLSLIAFIVVNSGFQPRRCGSAAHPVRDNLYKGTICTLNSCDQPEQPKNADARHLR